MFLMRRFILFLTLAVFLTSCSIEELNVIKKQTLTIASDYLYASDSSLFKDFSRKTNIKVKIIHLHADSISKKIFQNPLNVDFDMLMLSDIVTLNNIKNKNLLQKFSDEDDISNSNGYILLTGVDPIVYCSNRKVSGDSTSYLDLSSAFWYPKLDEVNLSELYNCIKQNQQWSSRESALWIHQAELKKMIYPINDSLAPRINALGFLSQFKRKSPLPDSLNVFQYFLFPDQLKSGLLYKFYGAGIVYQSSNFNAAKQLIQYLSKLSQAQVIHDKIGVVTYDQQTRTGYYKNRRYILNSKPINSYRFDSTWWNTHINYAKSMKIEVKKPVPIVNSEIVTDTLLVEN